ncbi:hypothetical protein JCM10213_006478 [Rhodosporidiobolus nylandii]
MAPPLPLELVAYVLSFLADDVEALETVCLANRTFLHLARRELYWTLSLNLRCRCRFAGQSGQGHGMVLDEGSWIRYRAVIDEGEASDGLRSVVKAVVISGGGWDGAENLEQRVTLPSKEVFESLLARCSRLSSVRLVEPGVHDVLQTLADLPSSRLSRLSSISLDGPCDQAELDLLSNLCPRLPSLALTVKPHSTPLALSSFTHLQTLTLRVLCVDEQFFPLSRTDLAFPNTCSRLQALELQFACCQGNGKPCVLPSRKKAVFQSLKKKAVKQATALCFLRGWALYACGEEVQVV